MTVSWVSKNSLLIRLSAKSGASGKSSVYHFEYTLTMRFRECANQIVSHGGVRHLRRVRCQETNLHLAPWVLDSRF